ncbi:SRPBCC family protein [Thiorhodovibrio frisius]|uniref:Polyketide cyclase / dehydrase and lipid transport n=1 Tax=Thiorhodovibrio frisius TaxID=631362 RepID=H8Z430_9GAMM|nr:SRPBCC family protein [Thiorhodovibrio frisius]EIC20099.1 Polyketide cyclase / dehydrase and lipid transport [Thiorhodovibrio frisius]WPL20829.1 Polyketide cyclase / dehydrase and lipid transport [Thiorhodovibrio frisius]
MVKARANILIERRAEQVFGFVADDFVENYARWSPEVRQIEALTPGPIGVGSLLRQVRVDQGRRSDNRFTVTAFESPARLEFAESTDLFRTGYWLAPEGNQTRLEFGFELRRLELYMRPFEKLIRLAIQEGAERVVRNIKTLAERELATGSTEPGN